jgi:hypothetical protein
MAYNPRPNRGGAAEQVKIKTRLTGSKGLNRNQTTPKQKQHAWNRPPGSQIGESRPKKTHPYAEENAPEKS